MRESGSTTMRSWPFQLTAQLVREFDPRLTGPDRGYSASRCEMRESAANSSADLRVRDQHDRAPPGKRLFIASRIVLVILMSAPESHARKHVDGFDALGESPAASRLQAESTRA